MLREFIIVPAGPIRFHLLRRGWDRQIACNNEAAIEVEVIGEHGRVEGAAVR